MRRHRFHVHSKDSKVGLIYVLSDETHAVWLRGNVLGTALAAYDLPHLMAKTEDEAWSWLPTDIEIAPSDTQLSMIDFIYKEGNKDWTKWFAIEPGKVPAIVDKVHTQKQGWVEFDTFSGQKMLINLSEVTRIIVNEDW